jgi:CheY-like chemotaxis protein
VSDDDSPKSNVATSRILIVEDNRDAAKVLEVMLSQLGHETQLAFDGLKAVDIARQFEPQIVLMDLDLPVLDGCEATRRIRAELKSQPRIVALTGRNSSPELAQKPAGFDYYFTKPVDYEQLEMLVTRIASGAGS